MGLRLGGGGNPNYSLVSDLEPYDSLRVLGEEGFLSVRVLCDVVGR